MKLINIILFIAFLSFADLGLAGKIVQQPQNNNQNLLVTLDYSVFQGIIKIQFQLLNDSFAENYNIKLIEVQINSNTYEENRYFSDLQQTTVAIDIYLKDAFKDMVVKVAVKQNQIQTRANKQMNGDFYQEINLGTQLPQLVSLDLSKSINLMQNSTWIDILRMFPLYLIFFNSFQGVYIILLADIKLPQRLYEIIRLLSCFYFKNIRGWNVSQDYPYDTPQISILGIEFYSSDSEIQLSLIGVTNNLTIDNLINQLPPNKGQQIKDEAIQAIHGLEIVQFIFMFLFIILEIVVKVFQLRNLSQKFKINLQFYSRNDINFEVSQIQYGKNTLVEMLNGQNSKINKQINHKQISEMYKTDKDSVQFPSCYQNQLAGSIITSFQRNKNKTMESPSLTQQLVNLNIIAREVKNANQNIRESNNKEGLFSRTNSLYENNQTENLQEKKLDQEPQKRVTIQIEDNKQNTNQLQKQYVTPRIIVNKVEDIQIQQPKIDRNFLFNPSNIKKILQNNQNHQETIKEADVIDNKICKQESFDESDYDIFNSINIQLEEQQNDIEYVEKNEQFKQIMQTNVKSLELSSESKHFICSQIDSHNLFIKAKNPYTLLLYQDVIQQVKDKYNEGITEYCIQSLYLREANIKICNQGNKNFKTIIPTYSQRVFSITSHNQEKYRELQNIFETQSQTKSKNKFKENQEKQNNMMQQNTRIFFDLDSYQNNTKLNVNNHLIHRETFQYIPYDS
ncbi:hypothetical protein ABPG72_006983 [Tetrahymena utriculariae]